MDEVRVDLGQLVGPAAELGHVALDRGPVAGDHLGRRRGVRHPRGRVLRDPPEDRLDRGDLLAVDPLRRLRPAADPDRRVRPLDGLRLDRQVVEAVELALVGHVVAGPQRRDRLEHLVHPPPPLAVRDPERLELLARSSPTPTPRTDRPAGQDVERRPLLRERDRIAEREDEDHRPEADRPRHAGEGAQERDGLQPRHPVRRRGDEQVVDEHRGLEAEVLGAPEVGAHLRERRGPLAERERREAQAELHRGTPCRSGQWPPAAGPPPPTTSAARAAGARVPAAADP